MITNELNADVSAACASVEKRVRQAVAIGIYSEKSALIAMPSEKYTTYARIRCVPKIVEDLWGLEWYADNVFMGHGDAPIARIQEWICEQAEIADYQDEGIE